VVATAATEATEAADLEEERAAVLPRVKPLRRRHLPASEAADTSKLCSFSQKRNTYILIFFPVENKLKIIM
jgi:hypothetical protein